MAQDDQQASIKMLTPPGFKTTFKYDFASFGGSSSQAVYKVIFNILCKV